MRTEYNFMTGETTEYPDAEVVIIIKTIDENISDCESAIQSYLNSEAKDKNYDDIMSACSYASAPNPYQDEAITFVTWRGDVWAYWYVEVDKIKANTRSMPTVKIIISELPLRKQVA